MCLKSSIQLQLYPAKVNPPSILQEAKIYPRYHVHVYLSFMVCWRWDGWNMIILQWDVDWSWIVFYQMIFGSLIRMVTTSSRFLMPSNTLSSKTVVNSCSIEVSNATKFSESIFKSRLRSASNFTSFTSSIYKSLKILKILVYICVETKLLHCVRREWGHASVLQNWAIICRHGAGARERSIFWICQPPCLGHRRAGQVSPAPRWEFGIWQMRILGRKWTFSWLAIKQLLYINRTQLELWLSMRLSK